MQAAGLALFMRLRCSCDKARRFRPRAPRAGREISPRAGNPGSPLKPNPGLNGLPDRVDLVALVPVAVFLLLVHGALFQNHMRPVGLVLPLLVIRWLLLDD